VTGDLKRRQEGIRTKHRNGDNSVKLYDKAYTPLGSVLRAELTMQRPEEFQVYRRIEGSPKGPLMWLPMRRGIADLHRRAEVSQRVNDRYLNALASTDDTTRLKELLAPLERPVIKDGKRSRALRLFDDPDRLLLEAISRGHQPQATPAARPRSHPRDPEELPVQGHDQGTINPHSPDCRLQCHNQHTHSEGRMMTFVASKQIRLLVVQPFSFSPKREASLPR
jgi:hypothetical protein